MYVECRSYVGVSHGRNMATVLWPSCFGLGWSPPDQQNVDCEASRAGGGAHTRLLVHQLGVVVHQVMTSYKQSASSYEAVETVEGDAGGGVPEK